VDRQQGRVQRVPSLRSPRSRSCIRRAGMAKDAAMQKYIETVAALKAKYA
jgi:hypothetical protein